MRQDETSRQRSPLQLIKMDPLYARRDITRVQYLQCKEEEYSTEIVEFANRRLRQDA